MVEALSSLTAVIIGLAVVWLGVRGLDNLRESPGSKSMRLAGDASSADMQLDTVILVTALGAIVTSSHSPTDGVDSGPGPSESDGSSDALS